MRVFTQIAKQEGRIDRVPRGETPVIELTTEGDQYITDVRLEQIDPYSFDRKTVDWRYTYYVVTPLRRV
jgi:hypothetical protein